MKPGRVLQERYKVGEFLGQGETGRVYLCQDQHLPGKQWAIKSVESGSSLQREVEIMLSLRHRNLPAVIDHFQEDGDQFLVLEFIEGKNLHDTVQDDGPVNEYEALRWGIQIARTLGYLHSLPKPVVFRDLRPERVIVTPDRHIKLVDFGLARYQDPAGRTTSSKGAVGFAAPEQFENPGKAEPASDIYSLGATLFYALTGKAPTPAGASRLGRIASGLSSDTMRIIERCMANKPQDRYRSADQVTLELERRLRRASRSNGKQVKVGWLALPLLLLLLMGAGYWWKASQPAAGVGSPLQGPRQAQSENREKAELLLSRGDTEEGIALLSQILQENPADAQSHILQQNAYAQLGGAEVLRLPLLTSLEGSNAGGFGLLYGYAQAQAELNGQGGINGRPLVLDIYDDRSQIDRAISLARTITREKNYPLCLGPYSSSMLLAVRQLFNTAEMPLLAPMASDPRVFDSGPYIFSIADPDQRRIEEFARHFLNSGMERTACLVNDDNVYCRTLSDIYMDVFGKEKAELLRYSNEPESLDRVVSELEGKDYQLVFIADYQSHRARELAAGARRVLPEATVAVSTAPFTEEAIDGTVLPTNFRPEEGPYLRHFRQMFGRLDPSIREASAYDVLMTAAAAIEEVGLQGPALAEHLKTVERTGITGPFTPGRVSDRRTIYIVEVKGKDFNYTALKE